MSMKRSVADTIRTYSMIEKGETVLCALSGGADSLSLLLCLRELGYCVCACHLNHCLRGAESDGDEAFCRDLCARYGIPFRAERMDAAKAAEQSGDSLETAARELRYAFFARCLTHFGADKIATAHNADDNLETMLFRLIRGTGTAGLAGIPPVREHIIRPLLFTERAEIERYLIERGIVWRTDHTNNEDFCTRNRIRHQVLPALRQISPAAARQAGHAAVLLRQDNDALEHLAQEHPEPCPAEWLNAQPEAVAARAVREVLRKCGVPEGETAKQHISAVLRLCRRGHGSVSLPGVRTAELKDGCLSVSETVHTDEDTVIPERIMEFGGCAMLLTQNREQTAKDMPRASFLYEHLPQGSYTVRGWKTGDRMTAGGARGARTLKRMYADNGITPLRRSRLPVLCLDGEIAAAAGIGTAEIQKKHTCGPSYDWIVWEKERK